MPVEVPQPVTPTIDIQALAREIAFRMDPEALLDAHDVGAMLKCASRYILEEYMKTLGFPKPLRLTGPEKRRSHPRWRRQDIMDWINFHMEGRSKRGGRARNSYAL